MVISLMATNYKVDRVLVDQGSSVNILFLTTFQKLGMKKEDLESCLGTLIGFAGERVKIRGVINLRTTFGARLSIKIVPLNFTVVNAQTSYNIILGQPTLNQLQVIVSTPYLCMKYLIGNQVGIIRAYQQTTCQCYKASLKIRGQRANPKKVGGTSSRGNKIQIDQKPIETTRIGARLGHKEEEQLTSFLKRNRDVFAWAPKEMPRVDPNFLYHQLSIIPGVCPIA
ncbi:hypothetical protein CR513_01031, partial [Mucuna pruriens]